MNDPMQLASILGLTFSVILLGFFWHGLVWATIAAWAFSLTIFAFMVIREVIS